MYAPHLTVAELIARLMTLQPEAQVWFQYECGQGTLWVQDYTVDYDADSINLVLAG